MKTNELMEVIQDNKKGFEASNVYNENDALTTAEGRTIVEGSSENLDMINNAFILGYSRGYDRGFLGGLGKGKIVEIIQLLHEVNSPEALDLIYNTVKSQVK